MVLRKMIGQWMREVLAGEVRRGRVVERVR